MAREFGAIPGVPEARSFGSRKEAADAGVHRPLQHGISGSESEGADSIVVSGGYEDDEDYGDEIVYTGFGGLDGSTGRQVADQELARQNLALAVSADRGLPVRVVRGSTGDPSYSPATGYRYDGLYEVESYWPATGRSGFRIWRYRLVKLPPLNPVTNPPSGVPPGGTRRRTFVGRQRLVRSTAVTEWVKNLYDYKCQICGEQIETSAGFYAEGAHIRPVGRPHDGPDEVANVVCLCPNDHVRVDRGVLGFEDDWSVIEISSGARVGALTIRPEHPLDPVHARYHRSLWENAH